ncbi:esterase [Castellaniella daejeonensis]|jgi:phospholipase/carboxylesterase|uniref:Esterase n=1 Tax=Castellaniella daejeonensis TaxID=659013 RepID=A0ABP3D240_9BURK|nr:esterase [Castellaniella sp.]HET8703624.1 esterase [Castellaniella sp.]
MPDSRPESLIIEPSAGAPAQLFVVLHGESAAPDQVLGLVAAIRQAFPQALIVQPYGPFGAGNQRRWIALANPEPEAYVGLVTEAGAALASEVRALQRSRGLNGEQTALVGFSEGAAVALEAVCSDAGLAGRALLFSTRFATLPASAPMLTTLHLLHGAADRVAPLDQARQVHGHLAGLGGDATLDMASGVGHALHEALIHQAIVRLQGYLPQRTWEAVMGAPDIRVDEYDADDDAFDGPDGGGGTRH